MTFARWTREDEEADRGSPSRAPDADECHGCLEVRPLMRGLAECENCGEDVCQWCSKCWSNWESNGEPECSICGREIDFTEGAPLCRPCEQTARAAGKQQAEADRYPDPELRR